MELYELSLTEVSEKIRTKEVSPVEVTQSALARLEEVEPTLTAFVTTTPEVALAQAKIAEKEIADGKYRGPLHGVPLAVKDLYDTSGIRTTASSEQRSDHVPVADSVSVAKLYEAGMVLIGKTHTHEFAYGATTPTTGNPWAPDRTPGGSSGGSGAAVASGVVHAALGSDTGGSIRIPAALCGTVGLKPTFGRASRVGVASLSWSLDHVGPLSRNVIDAALVMAAMSGYDRADPGTVDVPVPDMVTGIDAGVAGKKIGIPVNYYTEQVATEATQAASTAAATLEALGAELVEVTIPMAEHIIPTEWAIMMPEATAYHLDYLRDSPEKFTDETRTLLEIGAAQLATDYINALRLRTLIQAAWREMFSSIDVLLAPTLAATAALRADPFIRWGDGTVEGATPAYVRLSAPANVTGLPSLSVPAAFTADGLPLGVQIIGKPFAEPEILQFGYALEQNTDVVGRIAPVV
ncbi:MAG: aspartyl-tRNA(Asn)/glutamyl-tRNA(Gln) amidotransferase subunit [Mycobacterium sp.]|nr:aspartyl-tRNA(Asn)/glutamyl-tRNA(Gln) amidotransferase subunit [Mycobacterium sp.]